MITKNADSTEKLVETLQEIQSTMLCISNRLEDQSQKFKKLEDKMTLSESSFEKRLEELEDKGQFDIHLFIKKKWPYILVILGAGMIYVSKFVKF